MQAETLKDSLLVGAVSRILQRPEKQVDLQKLLGNIYTLDYGTYVDLMGTSRPPQVDFLEEGSEEDLVVPFDDRRSIRRIVLNEAVLS